LSKTGWDPRGSRGLSLRRHERREGRRGEEIWPSWPVRDHRAVLRPRIRQQRARRPRFVRKKSPHAGPLGLVRLRLHLAQRPGNSRSACHSTDLRGAAPDGAAALRCSSRQPSRRTAQRGLGGGRRARTSSARGVGAGHEGGGRRPDRRRRAGARPASRPAGGVAVDGTAAAAGLEPAFAATRAKADREPTVELSLRAASAAGGGAAAAAAPGRGGGRGSGERAQAPGAGGGGGVGGSQDCVDGVDQGGLPESAAAAGRSEGLQGAAAAWGQDRGWGGTGRAPIRAKL
jgi:hypothetical protein